MSELTCSKLGSSGSFRSRNSRSTSERGQKESHVEYGTRSFWYGARVGELYLHALCRANHRPVPMSTIAVHTASSDTKAHARRSTVIPWLPA
jgi:hypothetical protein